MKRFISLVFCSLFVLVGCGSTSYMQKVESDTDTTITEELEIVEQADSMIYVQVAGAVVKPGVYELPINSRVYEVIALAGGLLAEADDKDLNQAMLLTDGQKIYIYSKDEIEMQLLNESSASDGLVNINTADIVTLQTLPGIGASRAGEIISYREQNGNFLSIEDIKNVSGIGDGIYSKIEAHIKV